MPFLMISIIAAFLNAAQIKHCEIQGWDARVVITSNYISASLMGWLFFGFGEDHQIDATSFWLGLGGGLLWPSTFLILMQGIRDYGLSLAGSSSRLSLLVPVLFAVVFLDEVLIDTVVLDRVFADGYAKPRGIRHSDMATFYRKVVDERVFPDVDARDVGPSGIFQHGA